MKSDDEDDNVFRRAVKDVKPLEVNHADLDKPKPQAEAKQRLIDEERVLQESLESNVYDYELEKGDELFFARPGIQKTVIRKLRRGQFALRGELDLHGANQEQAKIAVDEFILERRKAKAYCVKIIHGKGYGSPKGKPVLKNTLNKWLQRRDDVLAFCSAPFRDGGTGAVYILLKTLK